MEDNVFKILGAIVIAILVFLCFIPLIVRNRTEEKIRRHIHELASNSLEITPEELLELREATLKNGKYGKIADDFVGVYIIFNETQNLYYVGQAKKVLQRVAHHFSGHGNGDVYADYKYGDEFTIKTIAFSTSGYDSLDKLEKDTIDTYDAYSEGYNKTRGNS